MKPECLKPTIDLTALSLGDWINLAKALDHKLVWAWYRFAEYSAVELRSLTMEDWEEIGAELEVSPGWAYHQYKEYR